MIRSVISHGYGITVGCGVTIDVASTGRWKSVLLQQMNLPGDLKAAALMRPSKSTKDMELKSLKKKQNDKASAGCSREVIERGAAWLGTEKIAGL